jgi:hypothetical protein
MTSWTRDELNKIEKAEELEIAARKPDNTLRNPTTIWVVRVADDLYVRSVNGRTSNWFKGIQVRHEGRIWAGGVEKDVQFVEIEVEDNLSEQIDAAYSDKYRRYAQSIIDSITSSKARSATIKLVPHSTNNE